MIWIAVDAGTTSIKAAAFDAGARVALATRDIDTLTPQPGWSEQDMHTVWTAVAAALREVASQIDVAKVAGICATGQGDGLWALDESGAPVRNAILWNDQRAADVVSGWAQDGARQALARACRTDIWPGTSAAIYAWIAAERPQDAARVATIFHAKDWIGYRLTGRIATDLSDATIPLLNLRTGAYDADAARAAGVEDMLTKLPPPQRSGDSLGPLTNAAAQATGLPRGTPVLVGTLDVAAMHVGAGLNEPGDALIILGTTAVVSVVTPATPQDDRIVGATVAHPLGEAWLNVQAPQSGASALDWLRRQFPAAFPDGPEDAIALAEGSVPGAEGVLFLPYLTGERAPFVAPDATASLLGLRATTTGADMARAVLEGVAFSLRHCAEAAGAARPNRFVITGGGARSAVWRQIIADVMNAPVALADDDELGLAGAAVLAGRPFGTGLGASGRGAESRATPPIAQNIETLNDAYRRYRRHLSLQGWGDRSLDT